MSTTPIPDAMILAAIERAALHRGRPGVPIWMILEHLGLPRRARRVRPQIRALTDAGAWLRLALTACSYGARPLPGAANCGVPAMSGCLSLHSIKRGVRRERSLSRRSSGSARRWPMCLRRARRCSTEAVHLMAGSRWRPGCERQHGVSAQPPTASGSGVSPPTIDRTSTTTRCRATYCWATRSVLAVASVAAAGATRISGETASEACNPLAAFCGSGSLRMMAATKPPQDAPVPAAAHLSPLLDATEAGRLLSVPASWMLAEARANRIPHVRLGRYVRFSAEELEEWWRARMRGPWRARGTASRTARSLLIDRRAEPGRRPG